jgi:hypothetical protein
MCGHILRGDYKMLTSKKKLTYNDLTNDELILLLNFNIAYKEIYSDKHFQKAIQQKIDYIKSLIK